MGEFSISHDKEVDEAFNGILSELLNLFFSIIDKNSIKAVILTGGFGRGEGGVFWDGAKYSLVNDIDLIVIPKKNSKEIRKQIPLVLEVITQKGLLKKSGLKQIDFTISSILSLKLSPNLISYYEVREGSQIVYGDYDLKNVIKKRLPEKLPLFDGTRLFYNRGYGLLIAFYILMKKLDSEQIFKYNIIIELQKASIAIGDALLLINKKYHYLYNQRGAHFFSLIKKKEFLLKDKINIKQLESLYIPAIEGKLKPNSEMFNVRNYEKLFEIRDAFLDFFLEYESSRLKMSFNNWITYSEYILKNDVNDPIYLKLRRKLKEININGTGGLIQKQMLAILPHLLLALKNDFTLDDNYLNNVIAQINDEKIANIVESNYDLLGYFLETFHHDGVISAIIEYEKAKKYN